MMEIVIKIPEEIRLALINNIQLSQEQKSISDSYISLAIINGIPLSKGHGRLGDLGKIYVELNEAQIEGTPEYKGLGVAKQILCDAKTIIEADKES